MSTTACPTFTTLGSGPTLLMLHDLGGSHLAFAPQVETFALAGWRAVAWNMPGYGRSTPVDPYTFKALAQSCAALIEALAVPQVALLGHGIGGMVAQELVARRPDLVNRLILCGAPERGCPPELASDAVARQRWRDDFVALHRALLAGGKSMSELALTLVPRQIGPGALPEGVRLALGCLAGASPSIWLRAVEASADFDRSASLELIRVPTLVIAGEHDREAPPARLRQLAERIDGCNYAELHGIGHLMQLEAPERFDALVLDFLERTTAFSHAKMH